MSQRPVLLPIVIPFDGNERATKNAEAPAGFELDAQLPVRRVVYGVRRKVLRHTSSFACFQNPCKIRTKFPMVVDPAIAFAKGWAIYVTVVQCRI